MEPHAELVFMSPRSTDHKSTKTSWYAERLKQKERIWWKQLFDRQAPYRYKLQSLQLGFVLDVGCGLGRNLDNLFGQGVGVDHNADCIAEVRRRGFVAYTSSEFGNCEYALEQRFDSLLFSHVLEHLPEQDRAPLVQSYLPYLRRPSGRIVMITPQEVGHRSDPTHKSYMGPNDLLALAQTLGLTVLLNESYPLPRWVGKYLFAYNENIVVAAVS